jgi:hypothetical protein
LRAQTCGLLGRHREAREALEASLSDPGYIPTRKSTFNLPVVRTYKGSDFISFDVEAHYIHVPK